MYIPLAEVMQYNLGDNETRVLGFMYSLPYPLFTITDEEAAMLNDLLTMKAHWKSFYLCDMLLFKYTTESVKLRRKIEVAIRPSKDLQHYFEREHRYPTETFRELRYGLRKVWIVKLLEYHNANKQLTLPTV